MTGARVDSDEFVPLAEDLAASGFRLSRSERVLRLLRVSAGPLAAAEAYEGRVIGVAREGGMAAIFRPSGFADPCLNTRMCVIPLTPDYC
jgi:hypothetical protein